MIYMFAYGLLLNEEVRNILYPIEKIDEDKLYLYGDIYFYNRIWNIKSNFNNRQFTSLGLTETEDKNKITNGMFYSITEEELDKTFLTLQKISNNQYELIELDKNRISVPFNKKDKIYTFISKDNNHEPSKEYPILLSILDICLIECFAHSGDFARKFICYTDKFNLEYMENDRKNPIKENKENKIKYIEVIDKIMEEVNNCMICKRCINNEKINKYIKNI